MRYQEKPRSESFPWRDVHIDQLKRLLADRLSASQIAAEMGGGLTRNAIIGKITRLGLSLARKPAQHILPEHRIARKRVERVAPFRLRSAPRLVPVETPAPISVDDAAIPAEQRRTLLTVRANECRWPVGDPLFDPANFFLCGGKRAEGSSYCPHHDRRSKR